MGHQKNCYICKTSLTTENSSLEHIILNAIGGKLKSKELLCKSCNEKIGSKYDAILAEQLNFFSTYINVDRDRGELQKVKGLKSEDGTLHTLIPDKTGKTIFDRPKIIKKETGKNIEFNITTNDIESMNKIFKDLKKRYPDFNIEDAQKNLRTTSEYSSEKLNISMFVGGKEAYRSIVKTGINFYIYSNGDPKHIEHLIPYISGYENKHTAWFSLVHEPYYINNDEIIHFLHVEGNSKEGFAYAFVDFFSAYSFIVCLSEDYKGKDFSNTYAYDLISNKEVSKSFLPQINRKNIIQILHPKQPTKEQFRQMELRINRTYKKADNIQVMNELTRIIHNSLDITLKSLGNPNQIDEPMLMQIIKDITTRVTPYYIHLNRKSSGNTSNIDLKELGLIIAQILSNSLSIKKLNV